MNAFQYGNEQRREKKIRVIFELSHEKMVIRVADQGVGFRLEDVPDPRLDENMLGEAGRGVLLMRAFMDEFDVLVGQGGGAELIMRSGTERRVTQSQPRAPAALNPLTRER